MSARRRAVALAAVGLAVALLAGCAGRLQKPEISLAGVELVGLGLVEQRLLLKLRISNPNDVDLPVKALSFDLDLDGQPFAKGASEQPVIVARQSDALLEVKVVSRLGDLLKQLRAARQNGKLGYRIHGRVEIDGSGSVVFDRSGEVPLPALDRFIAK